MRGKRGSRKRKFTRKKNSMKKLAIVTSKVEKYELIDLATMIVEVNIGKGKPLKL